MEKNPQNEKAIINLGVVLDKQGKYNEAQQLYNDSLKHDRINSKTYNNMAINLKKQGRLDESLKYYKKALVLEPKNHNFLYNVGLLYAKWNEY